MVYWEGEGRSRSRSLDQAFFCTRVMHGTGMHQAHAFSFPAHVMRLGMLHVLFVCNVFFRVLQTLWFSSTSEWLAKWRAHAKALHRHAMPLTLNPACAFVTPSLPAGYLSAIEG